MNVSADATKKGNNCWIGAPVAVIANFSGLYAEGGLHELPISEGNLAERVARQATHAMLMTTNPQERQQHYEQMRSLAQEPSLPGGWQLIPAGQQRDARAGLSVIRQADPDAYDRLFHSPGHARHSCDVDGCNNISESRLVTPESAMLQKTLAGPVLASDDRAVSTCLPDRPTQLCEVKIATPNELPNAEKVMCLQCGGNRTTEMSLTVGDRLTILHVPFTSLENELAIVDNSRRVEVNPDAKVKIYTNEFSTITEMRVVAVIVRSGESIRGGHFATFINTTTNPDGKSRWFELNDGIWTLRDEIDYGVWMVSKIFLCPVNSRVNPLQAYYKEPPAPPVTKNQKLSGENQPEQNANSAGEMDEDTSNPFKNDRYNPPPPYAREQQSRDSFDRMATARAQTGDLPRGRFNVVNHPFRVYILRLAVSDAGKLIETGRKDPSQLFPNREAIREITKGRCHKSMVTTDRSEGVGKGKQFLRLTFHDLETVRSIRKTWNTAHKGAQLAKYNITGNIEYYNSKNQQHGGYLDGERNDIIIMSNVEALSPKAASDAVLLGIKQLHTGGKHNALNIYDFAEKYSVHASEVPGKPGADSTYKVHVVVFGADSALQTLQYFAKTAPYKDWRGRGSGEYTQICRRCQAFGHKEQECTQPVFVIRVDSMHTINTRFLSELARATNASESHTGATKRGGADKRFGHLYYKTRDQWEAADLVLMKEFHIKYPVLTGIMSSDSGILSCCTDCGEMDINAESRGKPKHVRGDNTCTMSKSYDKSAHTEERDTSGNGTKLWPIQKGVFTSNLPVDGLAEMLEELALSNEQKNKTTTSPGHNTTATPSSAGRAF